MNTMRAQPRLRTTRVILLAALTLVAWVARGQFTVDWSTIDGGGSSSTGGVYSISGTIGQPDTGAMSGGNFTLQGGFWAALAVVQTPGAPTLSIQATNQTLVLSWPAPATGYVLQENPSLTTTNWTTVSNAPAVVVGEMRVTISSPLGNRFYRLSKP